jgi:hypothetical protein
MSSFYSTHHHPPTIGGSEWRGRAFTYTPAPFTYQPTKVDKYYTFTRVGFTRVGFTRVGFTHVGFTRVGYTFGSPVWGTLLHIEKPHCLIRYGGVFQAVGYYTQAVLSLGGFDVVSVPTVPALTDTSQSEPCYYSYTINKSVYCATVSTGLSRSRRTSIKSNDNGSLPFKVHTATTIYSYRQCCHLFHCLCKRVNGVRETVGGYDNKVVTAF